MKRSEIQSDDLWQRLAIDETRARYRLAGIISRLEQHACERCRLEFKKIVDGIDLEDV